MDQERYFLPVVVSAMVALLVGALVTSYILVNASTIQPEAPIPSVLVSNDLLPAVLLIPSLGISADIQHVGRTSQGHMSNPSNFIDVAWYQNGPMPGEVGSAVVAGHLDNALGMSAVFMHLKDLELGQEVHVRTASGTVLHFRVTRSVEYTFDAVPPEVFTATSGKYLNLITCSGIWLSKLKTYDHRLVVYATLVRS